MGCESHRKGTESFHEAHVQPRGHTEDGDHLGCKPSTDWKKFLENMLQNSVAIA